MQILSEKRAARFRPQVTTIVLAVYVLLVHLISLTYEINEFAPPPAFEFLNSFAFLGLICWWLWKDSLRTGTAWPLDVGMFLYAAWFVILPYHLIKTRGLGGLLDICLFAGVVILVSILASLGVLLLTTEIYN